MAVSVADDGIAQATPTPDGTHWLPRKATPLGRAWPSLNGRATQQPSFPYFPRSVPPRAWTGG